MSHIDELKLRGQEKVTGTMASTFCTDFDAPSFDARARNETLSGVVGVDGDVLLGQVAGPEAAGARAEAEIDASPDTRGCEM
jgi:hypothetical protein